MSPARWFWFWVLLGCAFCGGVIVGVSIMDRPSAATSPAPKAAPSVRGLAL